MPRADVTAREAAPALPAVVARHADEASFLWLQRARAVSSPRFGLRELARLDNRIAAHIDGLRVAEESGNRCSAESTDEELGALFAPTVLALEARDVERLEALLTAAEGQAALQPALLAAFGWTSAHFLQGTARQLLVAASAFTRRVAIACCAMHGVDPRDALRLAAGDGDPELRASAFRAAGDLGRRDVLPVRLSWPDDDSGLCRFWAVRSLVLLGQRGTFAEELVRVNGSIGAARTNSYDLGLQAMDMRPGHAVLQGLAASPSSIRSLTRGSGIVGDPVYVSWLLGRMEDPKLARLAGEAFSLITGVDLNADGFHAGRPEGFESGPNDDPDDPNVDMDPDDGLPWPDSNRVQRWWDANTSRFTPGQRYFMGAPVTREHCIEVLRTGYQRQRILAAHYLCLLEPGTPLFNTSAPAWRQQRLLAEMK